MLSSEVADRYVRVIAPASVTPGRHFDKLQIRESLAHVPPECAKNGIPVIKLGPNEADLLARQRFKWRSSDGFVLGACGIARVADWANHFVFRFHRYLLGFTMSDFGFREKARSCVRRA
jgi:hypothetical protein